MAGHGPIDEKERRNRTIAVMSILGVALAAGLIFFDGAPVIERDTPEVASLPPLDLSEIHGGLDYDLQRVAETRTVPGVFLRSLDVNLDRLGDVQLKKDTFFRIMLPIIARENDRIRDLRAEILKAPHDVDDETYDRYEVEPGDIAELQRRVDVIPASLALAQAALESGWGGSRFAQDGNNFYGMRTFDKDAPGIAPMEAEGFKVMVFDDIAHSVRAYIHNLNTFPSYADLRAVRAKMRADGETPDGRSLTDYLLAYSEVPKKYGGKLRAVIEADDLGRFDGVRLAGSAAGS